MRGRGPEIKPPKFLADLYRDLRDQRLLPLVILLLVAIVAVPIVLRDPTPAFVPPPADQGLAANIVDDSLMVVSAPAGLRRYGERLADRDPRDPFVDPKAPKGGGESAAAGGASSSTPVATEPTAPGGGSGSGSGTSSNGSSGSGSGAGDSGGGSTKPTHPVDPSEPSLTVIRMSTTVRFGKAGSGLLRDFADVERMRGFPKENPIVVFIGASDDGKRAVFSVSADASLVSGAGTCSSGRPRDCQFLTLRPGKAANIHDARRGVVWRLAVRSIELVETEIEPSGGADDGRGGPGAEPLDPEPVETASLSEVIGLYLLK